MMLSGYILSNCKPLTSSPCGLGLGVLLPWGTLLDGGKFRASSLTCLAAPQCSGKCLLQILLDACVEGKADVTTTGRKTQHTHTHAHILTPHIGGHSQKNKSESQSFGPGFNWEEVSYVRGNCRWSSTLPQTPTGVNTWKYKNKERVSARVFWLFWWWGGRTYCCCQTGSS